MTVAAISDKRVLVVGCTGQVALGVTKHLAKDNDVWGLARFRNPFAKAELDKLITCREVDLSDPDLSDLPGDFDYVLNFSVARTNDWASDLDANAGAMGFVMEHFRSAKAFLHCSSTAVYEPRPDHLFSEDDPLGDNHRVWAESLPFLTTYSIAKIAAESMVRFGAKRWELPSIICRLTVPYGDNGGWPSVHLDLMHAGVAIDVHPERPNRFNPIHEDDIMVSIPPLLAAADIPPPVVNWGGSPSSLEEWCQILGKLTGLTPEFLETEKTIAGVPIDLTRLNEIAGPLDSVSLEEGLTRMIRSRHPDWLV